MLRPIGSEEPPSLDEQQGSLSCRGHPELLRPRRARGRASISSTQTCQTAPFWRPYPPGLQRPDSSRAGSADALDYGPGAYAPCAAVVASYWSEQSSSAGTRLKKGRGAVRIVWRALRLPSRDVACAQRLGESPVREEP